MIYLYHNKFRFRYIKVSAWVFLRDLKTLDIEKSYRNSSVLENNILFLLKSPFFLPFSRIKLISSSLWVHNKKHYNNVVF